MPIFNSSTCVDMNYVIGIWIILFNFLRLLSSYSSAKYSYEDKQGEVKSYTFAEIKEKVQKD